MKNLKNIFESDNWIITAIHQGKNIYRVDAKRRFPMADKSSFFSKWGSKKYIDSLAVENYGKKPSEFNVFKY